MFKRRKTPAEQRSQEIDHEIKLDEKRLSEKHSILLLGTGESGKTTILKQMHLIYINEYTTEEKQSKSVDIRNNIHDSIYKIVSNLKKVRPAIIVHNEETKKAVEYILRLGADPLPVYTQEYYDNVAFLWRDDDIQEMYKRANEFHLLDSTEEFMKRLDVIRRADYVPDTQDILYCRVKTTAVQTIEFKIKHGGHMVSFVMHDVGGQRGQRRKWISLFEGIKTLLFVISVSDFDQVLREDESTNRLEEALTTFGNMFNSRYLNPHTAIVFLNKEDILEKKIQRGISIGTYFARYKQFKKPSDDEFTNTKAFIKEEVDTIVKCGNKKRTAHIHFTIATNTQNIQHIFDSVHEMLIDIAVKNIALY